jgi:hypothetical protein
MPVRMRRIAAAVVFLALGLVLLASHSARIHDAPSHRTGGSPVRFSAPGGRVQPPIASVGDRTTAHHGNGWVIWFLLAVFVVYLAFDGRVLWARLMGLRLRWRRRARRGSGDSYGPLAPDPAARDRVDEQVSDALDDAARDLRRSHSDDAIITCWLRLEQLAEQAGLGRGASQTSTELAHRLIADLGVDARPLNRLEALYREARFSDHRMSDADRATAAADLTDLGHRIRRRSGPRPGSTPTSTPTAAPTSTPT